MKIKFKKMCKINEMCEMNKKHNKSVMNQASKKFISLEERIKKYKGPNLTKEFSWDEPKGK